MLQIRDFADPLLNVHVKGVFFLTQTLLPQLADGGAIVNLSTGLTRFTTLGYAAYASMKGAVEVFTKCLAKELGSRGIKASVVVPHIVKTDFTKAAREAHPQLEAYTSGQTALGRISEPEDIGGVVAFLCSDAARWVNAQRLEATGGYSSRPLGGRGCHQNLRPKHWRGWPAPGAIPTTAPDG